VVRAKYYYLAQMREGVFYKYYITFTPDRADQNTISWLPGFALRHLAG